MITSDTHPETRLAGTRLLCVGDYFLNLNRVAYVRRDQKAGGLIVVFGDGIPAVAFPEDTDEYDALYSYLTDHSDDAQDYFEEATR